MWQNKNHFAPLSRRGRRYQRCLVDQRSMFDDAKLFFFVFKTSPAAFSKSSVPPHPQRRKHDPTPDPTPTTAVSRRKPNPSSRPVQTVFVSSVVSHEHELEHTTSFICVASHCPMQCPSSPLPRSATPRYATPRVPKAPVLPFTARRKHNTTWVPKKGSSFVVCSSFVVRRSSLLVGRFTSFVRSFIHSFIRSLDFVRSFVRTLRRRTTNDERRTTNDERRTTNDERRTTNDERRTADGGRRTADGGGSVVVVVACFPLPCVAAWLCCLPLCCVVLFTVMAMTMASSWSRPRALPIVAAFRSFRWCRE